jgi:putative spermidine/putrescine transport system permease protein
MTTLPTRPTGRPGTRGGRRPPLAWLGVLPFFGYLGIFLLLPTAVIAVQAFGDGDGRPTLGNVRELGQDYIITAFLNSLRLSVESSVIGAVIGALLAYAVVTGPPDALLRRVVTSMCGVFAQFGGVMLAFAFIATVGPQGFVTALLQTAGWDAEGTWLFTLDGLIVVYLYFQIPLMVLVFTPALEGLRPQWREATESLGGSTWQYWRHVAGPILLPPFLGALLLLFANAFSAFATAAALITQGGIILPLQIREALTSEVVLGRENVAKALALGMIVVVAIVMAAQALVQRRTSRWLR